jgi:hypothetical protein
MIPKNLANVFVLSVTVLMGGVSLVDSLPSAIAQGVDNETELIINQTMNNETAKMSNQTEMTNATTATPVNETANPIVDTLKDIFDG